ncbi:MAG TPA: hypothetical protein VF455_00510 [Chryseobacterium sp.]
MNIQNIFYYLIFFIIVTSCKSYDGEYSYKSNNDLFWRYRLTLNKDKTFLFKCIGHNCGNRWSYGYWIRKKDTLNFSRKILYDTLRFPKDNFDTLVLSDNHTPKLRVYNSLSQSKDSFIGLYTMMSIINPQKNFFIFPKAKLIIKKNKLYELDKNDKISKDYFIKQNKVIKYSK